MHLHTCIYLIKYLIKKNTIKKVNIAITFSCLKKSFLKDFFRHTFIIRDLITKAEKKVNIIRIST